MAKIYRVAIIGSTGRGNYGHGIDTVWKDIPNVEVVALADDHEAGLKSGVTRTGAKKGYANYKEMLEKERPEIVAVGPRWIDQHAEMVLAAVSQGMHVYMEKPFCRTLEEADKIVRACEMTHAKLAIAHQTRVCPKIAVVRNMIADGKIGTVLELRARGKEDARGGAEDLWVLGSHMMNLMSVFGGEPASCYAIITQQGKRATKADVVEGKEGLGPLLGDGINAMYTFKSGVTGYFGSHRGQSGSPSRYGLQIFGSKGVIEFMPGFNESVQFLADSSWSPGRSKGTWVPVSSAGPGVPEPLKSRGLHDGNVAAVKDLIEAIENNRQPACNVYEARQTIEMILAVFESHRLNGPVAMPLVNRKHPLTMLT